MHLTFSKDNSSRFAASFSPGLAFRTATAAHNVNMVQAHEDMLIECRCTENLQTLTVIETFEVLLIFFTFNLSIYTGLKALKLSVY